MLAEDEEALSEDEAQFAGTNAGEFAEQALETVELRQRAAM